MLTKMCKVLDLQGPMKEGLFPFGQIDEDSGEPLRLLGIERNDWIAMGRPEQVTVSIEPGDLLTAEDDLAATSSSDTRRRGDS